MVQFLITFVAVFAKLLFWALFIHVLMSWFASGKSAFGEIVDGIVQPLLKPLRWARVGMIDLSPLLALMILSYTEQMAQGYLLSLL